MRKNDVYALENCKIFKGVKDGFYEKLSYGKKYETVNYKKGDVVFSPNCFKKSLGIILKGSCEVSKGGSRLYMSTLHAGNVFGMSCVFYEDASFPTTVTAKENLRILFITKEELSELFVEYPVISENFLRILSEKIHFLNEKIESISAPCPKSSLKVYLLDTAKKAGANTFILPVSLQKLSSLLSIGRTSVYRAFQQLEEEGFLKKDGKTITIFSERNETE